MKVAILDDYQNVALSMADWSVLPDHVQPVVFRNHMETEEEVAETLRDFSIVVAMRERTPFRASLLQRLPNLKLLVTTGMRNASIDMEAAAKLGIIVSGTSGIATPTAELTWALLLGLARKLLRENEELRRNGPWQNTLGTDLHGKRLGVIGLGKIGTQVAKIGQAFGMEVSAWSPNLTEERASQAGVRYAAKQELLAASDFVTIHLVLGERTRGLIGAAELALLKPTAYLINTSRAPIVDQPALIEALEQGRIAGAGLDVFDVEPLPADHPFRSLPNVLATPHLGYVTEDNYRGYFSETVENIVAFLKGEPIRRLN